MAAMDTWKIMVLAIAVLFGGTVATARPVGAGSARGLVIHQSPQPLPSFAIHDGDGNPAGIEALRGRAVVLNLWASWCPPCVAELPALDRLVPLATAKGVAVVAVSLDRGGAETVTRTFARLGIKSLALRLASPHAAAQQLDATALPVTLLIDARGREVARLIGGAEWDDAKALRLLDTLASGQPLTRDMEPPPVRRGGAR